MFFKIFIFLFLTATIRMKQIEKSIKSDFLDTLKGLEKNVNFQNIPFTNNLDFYGQNKNNRQLMMERSSKNNEKENFLKRRKILRLYLTNAFLKRIFIG